MRGDTQSPHKISQSSNTYSRQKLRNRVFGNFLSFFSTIHDMSNLTALLKKISELGKFYQLPDHWLDERPYLFTDVILDLPISQKNQILDTIKAIESVIALPAFSSHVLSPALTSPLNPGVFFCYDFHLTPEGPKLIEINTNAGGAFLIALLEEAHGKEGALDTYKTRFMQMFFHEWHQARGKKRLHSIAIVDEDPYHQYFYPEFLLFQSLFKAQNIYTVITDPKSLVRKNGQLIFCTDSAEASIDLVYNRLTDFDLSNPQHQHLKEAYSSNEIVLTPHPHAYALYANKYNLTLLSDAALLRNCGVEEDTIRQLQNTIPVTTLVDPKNADDLWQQRKNLFFKPLANHGGKGVYRGKTITKRVFKSILENHYIAQTLIPPSEITIGNLTRKIDFRAYVYNGEVLNFSGRLYQGQLTNFRTLGSGFGMVRGQ